MLNNSVKWVSDKSDPTVTHPSSSSSSPPSTDSHPQDMPTEDEERIEKLFNSLDMDGNGKIDIHDLSSKLKGAGVNPVYAKKFLEMSDTNKSGDVSLKEFIHYVKEHEKNLKLVFSNFDKNKDGKLDVEELVRAFKELGIEIDQKEALKLVQRMDTDGSVSISYNEWRDFLLYAPSHDIEELIKYWRHSSALKTVMKFHGQNQGEKRMLIRVGDDLGTRSIQICTDSLHLLSEFICRSESSTPLSPHLFDLKDKENETRFEDVHCHGVHDMCKTYLDIGEDLNVPDDFTANEMISGMWWRHLVAGGIAGAVSRTFTAPLDRLKVYLQVHGSEQKTNIRSCLKSMMREGGVLSLWRGNGINVLKIAPESAIKFMAYEQVKRAIRWNHTRDLSIYERFVAGSVAGGISQSVIYPLEVMKTRLALRKTGEFKGIADAAKKIYVREGWKSFYRGYVPNLLGIIPYAGIDLAVYETLKNTYISKHGGSHDQQPGVVLLLACGTVSTICGQVCSYPLALIRTRLQAKVITSVEEERTCTMTNTFKTIIQREGFFGLYRGIATNFLKVVPAVSISYAVYERCRLVLGVDMT